MVYLKSQADKHLLWNGIHTDYCHKLDSFGIEMQSYMYTGFTDRQTNTHMWLILYIKCAAKQKTALLNTEGHAESRQRLRLKNTDGSKINTNTAAWALWVMCLKC